MPSICLCTLVLNEMEWLEKLYTQHCNWPGLEKWVFVESADRIYAETNQEMVSHGGLSVDGTTEFLEELAKRDSRVVHVKHGLSKSLDIAQGKCESRQRYLNEIEAVKPKFFIVVDADEFYTFSAQEQVIEKMLSQANAKGFVFKHRDIWRPQSVAHEDLFKYEVSGGFWDIPYCRGWRWFPDLRYSINHNTPDLCGRLLDHRLARFDKFVDSPEFIHMGFACNHEIRAAKNRYYEARGESIDPKRKWYCDSRRAFETWKPGDKLPREARVLVYDGDIPECFREGSHE